eukprot:3613274-Amphidinium_carterae.1
MQPTAAEDLDICYSLQSDTHISGHWRGAISTATIANAQMHTNGMQISATRTTTKFKNNRTRTGSNAEFTAMQVEPAPN